MHGASWPNISPYRRSFLFHGFHGGWGGRHDLTTQQWSFSFCCSSRSVWNIAGSDGTKRSSHSELVDEELRATGCTNPTSRGGNRLLPLRCSLTHVVCSTKSDQGCSRRDGKGKGKKKSNYLPDCWGKKSSILFPAVTGVEWCGLINCHVSTGVTTPTRQAEGLPSLMGNLIFHIPIE